MLRYIFTLIVLCAGIFTLSAKDNATEAQLKALQSQEAYLKGKLEKENSLRNITQEEASISTLDEANDHQDSICYELRSQIVDVQLQIKELKLQMGKNSLLNVPVKKNNKTTSSK